MFPQSQDGDSTRYFAANEVLLHVVISDPSMLVTEYGLDCKRFIQSLQENQIIQSSKLLSKALKKRGKKNKPKVLTFHRPADCTMKEPKSGIEKKDSVDERDDVTIIEYGYELDGQRITMIEDRRLPLLAVVSLQVDETNDLDLIDHLMELDGKIGINKSTRRPVQHGQYKGDTESALLPLIRSFTPNWYLAAYPGQVPGGGPAGIAVPYTGAAPTGFQLPNTFSLPSLGQSGTQAVEVYILDTIPDRNLCQQVQAQSVAATGPAPANPMVQTLLADDPAFRGKWHAGNATLDRVYCDPIFLPPSPSVRPNNQVMLACRDEIMSDHGTFIAGIIHSIAPSARLHLIQILNDYGAGDYLTLLGGLALALTPNLQSPTIPVVVNCSFGFQTPRPTDIVNPNHTDWKTVAKLIALSAHPAFEAYVLATMISCEDLLHTDNVPFSQSARATTSIAGARIIVAAAGNDWHDICNPLIHTVSRPEPHYPAYSDYVVGVGALDKFGNQTQYSNVADEPKNTGVWTFGGEIDSSTALTDPSPHASIVGMYINRTFPDGRPNTTNWACWAGTSFSTAIVSGIIANTLGQGQALGSVFSAAGTPTRVLPVTQVP